MNITYYTLTILWIFIHNESSSVASPLSGENVRLAYEEEFPFVVSIKLKQYENCDVNVLCTGSLITIKHVLTAAHCIEYNTMDDIRVGVGSTKSVGGRTYGLESMITHEQWLESKYSNDSTTFEDVCIITLEANVYFPGMRLPKLTDLKGEEYDNKEVTAVGWGISKSQYGIYKTPEYLQTAHLKVMPRPECDKYMKKHMSIFKRLFRRITFPDSWICSSSKPKILTTPGDSGGPLLYEKDVIIAVTLGVCPKRKSLNDNCIKNVYTRIDFVKSFIIEIIKSDNVYYEEE